MSRWVWVVVAAMACGGTDPEAVIGGVEASLASSDYAAAVAAADAALAVGGLEPAVAWRLESKRLEAIARSGKGTDALSTLDRLAAAYPAQVKAGSYLAAAEQVKAGGDATGAIHVLDGGLKRFAGDAELTAAVEAAKAGGSDEENAALEALGYLGDVGGAEEAPAGSAAEAAPAGSAPAGSAPAAAHP